MTDDRDDRAVAILAQFRADPALAGMVVGWWSSPQPLHLSESERQLLAYVKDHPGCKLADVDDDLVYIRNAPTVVFCLRAKGLLLPRSADVWGRLYVAPPA